VNSVLQSNLQRKSTEAFALVITLIMVVLAAILTIAFLSSATLDRTTSKSVNDRYQAELAIQNGLEAAKKALVASPDAASSVSKDDTFLVLRADGNQTNANGTKDAYYFIAKAQPGTSGLVDCYPLFAGGTSSQLTINLAATPAVQTPQAPTTAFSNPARDATGRPYPQLLSFHQSAYTQWQELHDPTDPATAAPYTSPYQRYTFWVEDLAGYLDASIVGNKDDPGNVHKRAAGTNAKEIALFTIFDSTLQSDSGSTLAKNLIDNREVLFTVPTLKQVAPPPGPTDLTQINLAVRVGIDAGGERNLIPFGLGFHDEGNPKTNLNTVLTNSSTSDEKVTTLFSVINSNLPQFATLRKGGFAPSEDYVKTLAAGMIAYATGEPVVGSNYRGLGLHPVVVEFFERFTWETNAGEATNFYLRNGTWWADVRAKGYVQLWNMTNKDIRAGTLTFTDINRYYAYVGGTSDHNKFEDAFGKGTITFDASNTLQANEFKVFKVYEHLYNFDTGLTIRPTGTAATVKLGSFDGATTDPTECGYLCEWNGKRTERAGAGTLDGARNDGTDGFPGLNYSGLQRNYVSLATPHSAPDPKWRGTLPGLRYDDVAEMTFNLGDPRSAYYISKVQGNVAYDKQSAWWGRIYQDGLVNISHWKAAETTVANWPDGGHSTGKGSLPSTTSTDPMALTHAALEIGKAPAVIDGSGTYTSITELSRIYDPIQWKPAGFPPTSPEDCQQKWRDAWKSNMTADANYGCASTLHIGSPEFKDFDAMKTRASRLLDLLSVSDRTQTRGILNLNTASRESLRALAVGIKMQQDAAIVPASVFGPVQDTATQGDMFADAVIANRPFLSTSQLSDIQTSLTDSTSKLFGNSSQWTSGGPTEWNNAAREEYFSRIFNLATVRSRNFRIFVTGQSLDKNGKVLSTVSRVFQLHLHATRDAAGRISAQSTEITYEKDI
jgi:hypothetical protein